MCIKILNGVFIIFLVFTSCKQKKINLILDYDLAKERNVIYKKFDLFEVDTIENFQFHELDEIKVFFQKPTYKIKNILDEKIITDTVSYDYYLIIDHSEIEFVKYMVTIDTLSVNCGNHISKNSNLMSYSDSDIRRKRKLDNFSIKQYNSNKIELFLWEYTNEKKCEYESNIDEILFDNSHTMYPVKKIAKLTYSTSD